MSAELFLQVLHWAVPGGLGAACLWLLSRDVRRVRTAKEIHDTYKQMYEDVSSTLTALRDDYDKIYKICFRMERAMSRAPMCRYWVQCPIRVELPDKSLLSSVRNDVVRQSSHGHRARDSSHGEDDGSGRQRRNEDSDDGPS